jgi:hypothetical protein
MTDEEKQIYDKIQEEGTVSDLIGGIRKNIKILSDTLEEIRVESVTPDQKNGELAVKIFNELESLHVQLSSLTQSLP